MALLRWHDLAGRRGERLLFHRLSATFEPGEVVRITGENGVGKSTLLRMVAGLLPVARGTIYFRDQPLSVARDAWLAEQCYLGHALAANELLSPRENVRFLCALMGAYPSSRAVDEALAQVGLAAQRDLPLKVLSAGQRRRVGLARLFFARTRTVWLLDEPLTALDQAFVTTLTRLIEAHAQAGGLILMTTHQEAPFCVPVRTLDLGAFRPARRRAA